ncbi:MAG: type II toxin-antitoxin system VapC family toxin [Thiotrichales bacterium]
MNYLLDTNILIYLIKNKPPAIAARVDTLDERSLLGMSFITYAELLKGAERSTRKAEALRTLERLTAHIPVQFAIERSLCAHYATQATQLKIAGTPIGANDLWIACHALSVGATLVTNNTREFERVQGLRLENWTIE